MRPHAKVRVFLYHYIMPIERPLFVPASLRLLPCGWLHCDQINAYADYLQQKQDTRDKRILILSTAFMWFLEQINDRHLRIRVTHKEKPTDELLAEQWEHADVKLGRAYSALNIQVPAYHIHNLFRLHAYHKLLCSFFASWAKRTCST